MSSSLVIPQHVAAKLAARAETCGSCKWRWADADLKKNPDIECRRFPPSASVLMVPVAQGPLARPGQQMQGFAPQTFAVYPLVRDTHYCGEWSPANPQ